MPVIANQLPAETTSKPMVALGLLAVACLVVFVIMAASSDEIMRGASDGGPSMRRFHERMRGGDGTASVISNLRSTSRAASATMANIDANLDRRRVSVQVPSSEDRRNARDGLIMEDIKFATRGDGLIRSVEVNGRPVDSKATQLAMFENHDFMPRDEFTYPTVGHLYDPGAKPQRSHFRPMSYPLVWSKGMLGMDVIKEQKDLTVLVADQMGRAPQAKPVR